VFQPSGPGFKKPVQIVVGLDTGIIRDTLSKIRRGDVRYSRLWYCDVRGYGRSGGVSSKNIYMGIL
jgi:hypothetical protein